MRKAIIILIAFIGIVAKAQTDPRVLPYVASYIVEAQSRGISIDTTGQVMILISDATAKRVFRDYRADWIARGTTNCKLFVFNINKWTTFSDTKKEMAVYHEMMHYFGRLTDGSCALMLPESNPLISESNYIQNKQAILDEAFGLINH